MPPRPLPKIRPIIQRRPIERRPIERRPIERRPIERKPMVEKKPLFERKPIYEKKPLFEKKSAKLENLLGFLKKLKEDNQDDDNIKKLANSRYASNYVDGLLSKGYSLYKLISLGFIVSSLLDAGISPLEIRKAGVP
jgi:hypothetical protein